MQQAVERYPDPDLDENILFLMPPTQWDRFFSLAEVSGEWPVTSPGRCPLQIQRQSLCDSYRRLLKAFWCEHPSRPRIKRISFSKRITVGKDGRSLPAVDFFMVFQGVKGLETVERFQMIGSEVIHAGLIDRMPDPHSRPGQAPPP